jgi:protein involved in polysaccharide export with SLBB domain
MDNLSSDKFRRLCSLIALGFLGLVCLTAPTLSQDYTLGPGDRVRVEVFGRPDLSGQFEIRPSGRIRLPLVGEVKASGLSVEQLEETITAAFRAKAEKSPSVIVSVEKWQSVYVTGHVRNPRAVEFVTDLNVLKAVAAAGGYGPAGSNETSLVLEHIRAREGRNVAALLRETLLARRSRLTAERDGKPAPEFPPELQKRSNESDIEKIISSETSLFRTRLEAFNAELEGLKRRISTFETEIEALNTERGALEEQLKLISEDVDVSRTLKQKGLEIRARNTALERTRLEIIAKLAENGAFLSRATTNLQDARQKLVDVPLSRTRVLLEELAATEQGLRETAERETAGTEIMNQTRRLVSSKSSNQIERRNLVLTIVRDGQRQAAEEMTTLYPGDILEVLLLDPGTAAK